MIQNLRSARELLLYRDISRLRFARRHADQRNKLGFCLLVPACRIENVNVSGTSELLMIDRILNTCTKYSPGKKTKTEALSA